MLKYYTVDLAHNWAGDKLKCTVWLATTYLVDDEKTFTSYDVYDTHREAVDHAEKCGYIPLSAIEDWLE